jgi:DNA modification methylase
MQVRMTKPYYRDELVTLYHGDSLDPNLSARWLKAHVLVTDPPYGMSLKSGWKGSQGDMHIANDATTRVRDEALSLWGSRPALCFGRWDIPVPHAKQCLVWDKGEHVGMGDLNLPWKPNWEAVYVTGDWPQRAVARGTSVLKSLAVAGTLQSGRGNQPSKGRDHPTPKPVGLMERLIESTQGVIADPFAGSGSTLVAARNLGRPVIGVELEERYCELIATRLQQQAFDFGVT